MSGSRRLLVVCSQDEDETLDVPGWEGVPYPVSRVVPIDASWSGECDAVVVTSRHAVPWLSRHLADFRGMVGVSGPSTGLRVKEAGFRCAVPEIQGGAGALAVLDLESGAKVLFPCAVQTAGSVEALAKARGIELTRLEVYRLEACQDPLGAVPGSLDAVLFLSGQTVRHFLAGVPESVVASLGTLPAICTETAQAELLRAGWNGPLLVLEKKGGRMDLSRLLLKATLS